MTISSQEKSTGRLVSLDAYRGFVMLFMASSLGVAIRSIATRSIELNVWDDLDSFVEHASWVGCAPWDLIQPAFMFIVGAAMPYSYANRQARGQSWRGQFRHALGRSAILILLGIFLASNGQPRTDFTFVNVLAQIGLGYSFAFLFVGRSLGLQLLATILILLADWAAFAIFPAPRSMYDYGTLALPPDWNYQPGFFAHWEKHSNIAAVVDQKLLNFFPRSEPFRVNEGGYTTLNFIPSIATILIGVMAGQWLRTANTGRRKILGLFLAGALCLIVGQAMGLTVCPIVKRLWTPSWVLFSASWSLWLLAFFYGVIDVANWKRWAFPFVVVGMNSLAMYLMAQLSRGWMRATIATHANTVTGWLHERVSAEIPSDVFGDPYGPLVTSCAVLVAWWLVCLWLYRERIFIRI